MKIVFLVSLVLLFNHFCFAQSAQDPDWPCIQVLVPEISAASIWDGPAVEEFQGDEIFRQHSRGVVSAVVDAGEPLTESLLDDYTARFDAGQHNASLTFLFKSFLDSYNTRRHGQIATIKRYTKSQVKSAKTIENLMNQKAELEKQPGSEGELEDIESRLHWQKRMFKEREQTFRYLCELPQEILQQAGEVARMISAKLNY